MAQKAPEPSEPLDVEKIHYLVRLMKRYDLTDLNISDGQLQIRLRRRGPEASTPILHGPAPAAPTGASHSYAVAQHLPPPAAPSRSDAPAPAQGPAAPQGLLIRSPMVGTFYASSAPDSPSFVTVGSTVQPDTTVCIIEAMKVFTDIPAGVSGTIAEILAKNGQPVEFDQPMFRVIPS
jgi:acetyl-CoA carboxylase biotin carboxyl carrier protein